MGTVEKKSKAKNPRPRQAKRGGQKSKIFILHGWAYTTEKWNPFLRLLEQSGIDYEMLKIPGLTAPLKQVWTINDYVEWLATKVKNYRGKTILLGHSNGGRIISAFTAKYPSKVASVILIDSAGIAHNDLINTGRKIFFDLLAKSGKKLVKSNRLRRLLYKVAGERDYYEANEIVKKTMVNLISIDFSGVYAKISVPTLIIWGKNDSLTPLSDGIKMNKLIQGSNLVVLEDARHAPQFTNPEEVVRHIMRFINNYGNI